ncbi:MAG: TIGR03790 family protein [Kiritimatiellia bacterium]
MLGLLLCLLPAAAWAGGGPLNALVVVNGASRDSRALGAYYLEKHGLPRSHLCSIKVNPRATSLSLAEFERDVRRPILAHVADQGLAGQIHFLVLCLDIPSRVENDNGITSVLYYGYKPATPGAPQCHVASNSVNQYYGAESAYTATAGWNRTNAPIPFLLTAADLETAKRVVDRGAASVAAFPEGAFCLYGSADSARNIRHRAYSVVARQFELLGRGAWVDVNAAASPPPARPILGYLNGLAYLPTNLVGAAFAPGAIAEHLTSCAGMIPDPCLGQSSVWDWMRLGATASYGTVTEPCAFEVKFPDPMIAFWYARGFTAGEALAMSVRHPYQGLWVGDPLAAPFAAPPSVRILTPARNAKLDGETALKIAVAAHERGAPPVFLDLYVDGRHHAPIARPFAPVGNELTAQIGTNRFAYVGAPGEDLFAVAAGLAWAINAKGAGQITASAKADRIEISVRDPLGPDGQPLPFSVAVEQGFAPGLYLGAVAGTDRLIVADGAGRAMATLHLGHARAYEIEYPLDLSGFAPGPHVLTLVVRDGTAMQCQAQTELPLVIPERPAGPAAEPPAN